MKKTAFILVILVLVAELLSSCAKNQLIDKQGGLYDKKAQVYYSYAPLNVEAVDCGDIYMTDANGVDYRTVKSAAGIIANPADMLYDNSGKTLIYNSEAAFPTFAEFEPVAVTFYIEQDSKVDLTVDDNAEAVTSLADILNNPYIDYPSKTINDSYRLRFSSVKFPYFTYIYLYIAYTSDQIVDVKVDTLDGYEYIEGVPHEEAVESADGGYTISYNYGKYFLYDRDSGKCYMAQYIYDNYINVEE